MDATQPDPPTEDVNIAEEGLQNEFENLEENNFGKFYYYKLTIDYKLNELQEMGASMQTMEEKMKWGCRRTRTSAM